jgi:hypothetical protein
MQRRPKPRFRAAWAVIINALSPLTPKASVPDPQVPRPTPPASTGRTRYQGSLAWFVGIAALLSAFFLPFLLPGNLLVYSAAYIAGANNKLATIALALLSAIVALCAARGWIADGLPSDGDERSSRPLSGGTILAGCLLVALWTGLLGWAITHSGNRYGESDYFLERSRDLLRFGGRLYRDFEFPYGPLLLLPPVWLARLGPALSTHLQAFFFAWFTLLNVAGIGMAGYCLNALPLSSRSRTLLFALFCFEQINPLMGPNYSLGKFLLPFAVLLWGARRVGALRRAVALAAGHLLTLLVSPELGVGLTAGIVAWATLEAWRARAAKPLLACLAPVFGYAVFTAFYGAGFLDRLQHASAGALNLIIEPLPDMLIFLVALVWLAPLAVGLSLRRRSPGAPVLAGVFLLSLGLLPGALGRSDPLHVFFNGLGFLLLAMVGLERLGRRHAALWSGLTILLCLQVQATNFKIYTVPLRSLLASIRHPAPERDLDAAALARLQRETQDQPVATPVLQPVPLQDELALRNAGIFVEDKYPGLAEIWDPAEERQKIARLRTQRWALLPQQPYTSDEGLPNHDKVKLLFRLGYQYPQRRAPYVVGNQLQRELDSHWVRVDRFGSLDLLHRVD